jgi:serine/threonine-protein kinase RsbW
MNTQTEREAAVARRLVPVLNFEVPAAPASVSQVRHALTAFAGSHGADEHTRSEVALAVSEAATNVVLHAYGGRRHDAPLRVVAVVHEDALDVLVADEGLGTSRRESPAQGLGLGLGVIAETTFRSEMRPHEPHGTEMWMRFMLGAGGPPPGRSRTEHPVPA